MWSSPAVQVPGGSSTSSQGGNMVVEKNLRVHFAVFRSFPPPHLSISGHYRTDISLKHSLEEAKDFSLPVFFFYSGAPILHQ